MSGYKRRKGFDCASIFSRRPIYDTHVCDEQTDRQTNSIYTACYAVAVRGKNYTPNSLTRSFIHSSSITPKAAKSSTKPKKTYGRRWSHWSRFIEWRREMSSSPTLMLFFSSCARMLIKQQRRRRRFVLLLLSSSSLSSLQTRRLRDSNKSHKLVAKAAVFLNSVIRMCKRALAL